MVIEQTLQPGVKLAILIGRKKCITLDRKYEKTGNIFTVYIEQKIYEKYGHHIESLMKSYKVTTIHRNLMPKAIEKFYKEEGFETSELFKKYLTEALGMQYDEKKILYSHMIEEVKEK